MLKLLISKINDINVIQTGDSEVVINNRSQRVEKPKKAKEVKEVKKKSFTHFAELAKVRKESKITEFQNTAGGKGLGNEKPKPVKKEIVDEGHSIDLGGEQDNYSTQVFCLDQGDNNELTRICKYERDVIITDKFKGKLKVFITSVTINDGDTHPTRSIYNISCVIQTKPKELPFNYEARLETNRVSMFKELQDKIELLSENALSWKDENGALVTPSSFTEGYLTYVDDAVDIVRAGTILALNSKIELLKSYRAIRYRIEMANTIIDTLAYIVHSPIEFYGLLRDLAFEIRDFFIHLGTFIIPKRLKPRKVPIYEPIINARPARLIDQTLLSQAEKDAIAHQFLGTSIVNNFKAIDSLNDLLDANFDTQDDFEELVEDLLNRIHYCGYDSDFIVDLTYNIEAFANTQNYRRVITKKIKNPNPLLRIVFEEYGNLDDYDFIEGLNNFKDNDYIEGDIKLLSRV